LIAEIMHCSKYSFAIILYRSSKMYLQNASTLRKRFNSRKRNHENAQFALVLFVC